MLLHFAKKTDILGTPAVNGKFTVYKNNIYKKTKNEVEAHLRHSLFLIEVILV